MDVLANIFGYIIRIFYNLVGSNYGLSIVLFTIFTKIILFPLYIKQIKSTEEMTKIAPEDKKIREKYKNDKQKMTEELTKLYSEHKINPVGGCLPLLIQIPIIFAMFAIVREPLTYVKQVPNEQITIYAQQYLNKDNVTKSEVSMNEINIAKKYDLLDMNFIGLNLGDVPSNSFSDKPENKANPVSLIIPILTLLITIYQTKQMQNSTNLTDEQKQMQKSTNMMLPFLSAFISYTMPLALGIYWLLGSIIQILQQAYVNKVVKKDLNNINKGDVLKLKG